MGRNSVLIFMAGKGGQAGPAAGTMPAGGGDGNNRSSFFLFEIQSG